MSFCVNGNEPSDSTKEGKIMYNRSAGLAQRLNYKIKLQYVGSWVLLSSSG